MFTKGDKYNLNIISPKEQVEIPQKTKSNILCLKNKLL